MKNQIKSHFYIIFCSVLLAACHSNEQTETSTNVKDSVKTDTVQQVAVKDTTTKVLPVLTGDALKLVNKWKAESVEMKNGIKLTADIIDLRFTFNNDLSFDFSEDNKADSGTWKLSEDSKTLELTYKSTAVSKLKVKELKADQLVLAGKEHGLERTYVLKINK